MECLVDESLSKPNNSNTLDHIIRTLNSVNTDSSDNEDLIEKTNSRSTSDLLDLDFGEASSNGSTQPAEKDRDSVFIHNDVNLMMGWEDVIGKKPDSFQPKQVPKKEIFLPQQLVHPVPSPRNSRLLTAPASMQHLDITPDLRGSSQTRMAVQEINWSFSNSVPTCQSSESQPIPPPRSRNSKNNQTDKNCRDSWVTFE